jgi:hypothetical protein
MKTAAKISDQKDKQVTGARIYQAQIMKSEIHKIAGLPSIPDHRSQYTISILL